MKTAAASVLCVMATMSSAQTADLMVVFDGSGSMWGQISGRTKIEIARDTLSSVLSEVVADQPIGMIAYGHRQRGVCSDIETVVPIGPASQTVPRMIAMANGLTPKGKTPLTDAVRRAAEELRFTENAATVVLVTDGVETCNADPCALGAELESLGIDFTAHVVGFGLSAEEGRQVQCLAQETGGMYLEARDADGLADALRQTVQAPVAPDPADFAPATRDVRFQWRDTEGSAMLGARQLQVMITREDGSPVAEDSFHLGYPEGSGNSGYATLPPGRYLATIRRDGQGDTGYTARFPFDVQAGDGVQLIEGTLGARIQVNVFVNPNLPFTYSEELPSAIKGTAWVWVALYPISEDGVRAEDPIIKTFEKLDAPIEQGRYLLRGELDRFLIVEKEIEITQAGVTEFDLSFDATQVYIQATEADGTPVQSQTTYWYDQLKEIRNHWRKGYGASRGSLQPFYLPAGNFSVNVGGEGYGDRRSIVYVEVPGDFAPIRLQVGEGERLTDAQIETLRAPSSVDCVDYVAVERTGCLARPTAPADAPLPQGDPAQTPTGPDAQPGGSTPLGAAEGGRF